MVDRGAEMLFQRLTDREETTSVAIAPNESFSAWTKTFTDQRLCAAIVDRLTFAGNILETGTDSYRLAHALNEPQHDQTRHHPLRRIGMKVSELQFDEKGLVPAVVQEHDTGEVLILGYMNADALRATQAKGLVTFWSRSRQVLWTKGETSGNHLRLVRIHYNCENNSLLVKARLEGEAACHTGNRTCFYRPLEDIHDARACLPESGPRRL